MSVPVILGETDGPTSVFLAGELGGGWINVFGLVIVIFILIPNIIYVMKFRGVENKCTNKIMNVIEQIGRYACMILMVFHIGKAEFAFGSVPAFLTYLIGNALLVFGYWLVWILYFIKQSKWKSMVLAILPTAVFLVSGVALQHVLLIIAAILFGVGHIYVTWKNVE